MLSSCNFGPLQSLVLRIDIPAGKIRCSFGHFFTYYWELVKTKKNITRGYSDQSPLLNNNFKTCIQFI